jgi:hypothetical protein
MTIKDTTQIESDRRVNDAKLSILDGSRMDANAARARMEMTPDPIMTTVDAILANQRKQYERIIDDLQARLEETGRALGDALDELADCKERIIDLEGQLAADDTMLRTPTNAERAEWLNVTGQR